MPSTENALPAEFEELSDREQSALSIWIGDRDAIITSTELGNKLDLENTTQRTRLLRSLEERDLVRTWIPDEREDGRPISPAMRAELTAAGREFVEENAPHLDPNSDELVERLYVLEEQVDELANQVAEQEETATTRATQISELREELSDLKSDVDDMDDEIWPEFLLEQIQDKAYKADKRSQQNKDDLGEVTSRLARLESKQGDIDQRLTETRSLLDNIDDWLRSRMHPAVELVWERWDVPNDSPVLDEEQEDDDPEGLLRGIFGG